MITVDLFGNYLKGQQQANNDNWKDLQNAATLERSWLNNDAQQLQNWWGQDLYQPRIAANLAEVDTALRNSEVNRTLYPGQINNALTSSDRAAVDRGAYKKIEPLYGQATTESMESNLNNSRAKAGMTDIQSKTFLNNPQPYRDQTQNRYDMIPKINAQNLNNSLNTSKELERQSILQTANTIENNPFYTEQEKDSAIRSLGLVRPKISSPVNQDISSIPAQPQTLFTTPTPAATPNTQQMPAPEQPYYDAMKIVNNPALKGTIPYEQAKKLLRQN